MATRTPLYLDFEAGEVKEFDAGDAIDSTTSKGVSPAGGTTGQVLKKLSNTDYDFDWAAASGSSDIALNLIAPAVDETITAGYSAYVSGYYEIADTKILEIGYGSVFEIG